MLTATNTIDAVFRAKHNHMDANGRTPVKVTLSQYYVRLLLNEFNDTCGVADTLTDLLMTMNDAELVNHVNENDFSIFGMSLKFTHDGRPAIEVQ